QNNLRLAPDPRISLLAERLEERANSTFSYDRSDRDVNSLGLIYKGRLDRLRVQASVRNDRYTDHGNQTTGGLGLDLDLSAQWQVGIAGSTGFHAPTFADLYQDYPSAFYKGNPDLKPEKSRNIEAHVQYRSDATLFRV